MARALSVGPPPVPAGSIKLSHGSNHVLHGSTEALKDGSRAARIMQPSCHGPGSTSRPSPLPSSLGPPLNHYDMNPSPMDRP
ncbi:hypothetical protein F511_34453 [Dorcoceras hygrometricum]|uniref:Uncharacterized protein n=1 Tax=Dorcoceras hygrometricum TaxID=472368 RepID=A0A2Z7BWK1_9LAMI|nr:hypothetical protein F511_34453 [Dorcoceras hygrometricum]